jgi:hypothetical protein
MCSLLLQWSKQQLNRYVSLREMPTWMSKTTWDSHALLLKSSFLSFCMQCFLTKQCLMYGSYYDDKDDQVTTRMTNDPKWWCGDCHLMTKVNTLDDTLTTHGMTKIWPWWSWWQVVTICDDHLDKGVMVLKIMWWHLTTSDSIWKLQLAIFIAKVKVAYIADE